LSSPDRSVDSAFPIAPFCSSDGKNSEVGRKAGRREAALAASASIALHVHGIPPDVSLDRALSPSSSKLAKRRRHFTFIVFIDVELQKFSLICHFCVEICARKRVSRS
jgi:hypothetical protein